MIHIEVQASFEKDFSERMFLYYALIYAKYGVKDIRAIAIFTDNKIPKHYDTFTMRKIITRYYHKHGRNGLEDMCDLVEIDIDFAENIIKEQEK